MKETQNSLCALRPVVSHLNGKGIQILLQCRPSRSHLKVSAHWPFPSARRGVTVLLVEQNVFEALQISHRAYVLQTGRVVLEGKGDDLISSDLVRKAYLGM